MKTEFRNMLIYLLGLITITVLVITLITINSITLEKRKEVLGRQFKESEMLRAELETELKYAEDRFTTWEEINMILIEKGMFMDSEGNLYEYKQKVSYDKYQELDELALFYERTIELYTNNGKSTHWQRFFLEQKQKNSAWYQEYLRIESLLLILD